MTRIETVSNFKTGSGMSPAALMVQLSCGFKSDIHMEVDEVKTINAKSIMGMMSFDYAKGKKVVVTAEGPDEEAAAKAVAAFVEGR